MYVIHRTAKLNPDIAGRTLWLTDRAGMWTLELERAVRFRCRVDAEHACERDDVEIEKID